MNLETVINLSVWPRLHVHLWKQYVPSPAMSLVIYKCYYPVFADNSYSLFVFLFFQSAHNHHEAPYSVALPENGHLTSPTYQFLRQAFLTIYASMLRWGWREEGEWGGREGEGRGGEAGEAGEGDEGIGGERGYSDSWSSFKSGLQLISHLVPHFAPSSYTDLINSLPQFTWSCYV